MAKKITIIAHMRIFGLRAGQVGEVEDSPLVRAVLKAGRYAELIDPPELEDLEEEENASDSGTDLSESSELAPLPE